jgi:hypothetical protein
MTNQRNTDEVIEQKVAANRDDEFVVFHIGLRTNAFWKVHRWLPIFSLPRAWPGNWCRSQSQD